jgi:hypothetical protein
MWQPGAYADQLAAARASGAVLSDPLTGVDGRWPVSTDGRYSYTGDAYALSSDDERAAFAWASPTFGDVTLEVTVRHTTDFDLTIAGVILRAEDATQTMLVFTLDPSGEWQLYRLPLVSPDELDNGRELTYEGAIVPVSAIHQGLDATNHLDVMMRGTAYAFFINDQFVGTS